MKLTNKIMLITYADSLGKNLSELKEMLEMLIMEGKEDYTVYSDDLVVRSDIYIRDKEREVYL